MRTTSFGLVISLVLFAGCSGGDGETPAEVDSGQPGDTATTDTGTPADDSAIDTGTADSGTTDAPSDAPTDAPLAEPKLTVVKLSETAHDRLFGVTYDKDGNILATGVVAEGVGADADFAMVVARFKPNGTLDTTFGTGGFTKKNVIAKKGGEIARGIVVQSTGKIVISGVAEHAGATDDRDRDVYLVRFNADGSVDNGFGTMGVVTLDLSAGEVSGTSYIADATWGLNLLADDGLLVTAAAKATGRTDTDWALVKLKSDGTKDMGFGTMGVAWVDIDNTSANARTSTVLADGSIVSAGYYRDKDMIVRPALFKLKPDGKLDTAFGTNGIWSEAVLPHTAESYGAALQGTNFVTIGYGRSTAMESLDWISMRISATGTWDKTYGTSGLARIDVAMQNDNGRALLVLPDERVLMVGGGRPTATTIDGMVAILSKDGKPDTTWGTGGYKLFDVGGPADFFWGVALSPSKDTVAVVGLKGALADGTAGTDDSALLTIPLKK
jgi:uncharacterized delta-60 repeat protein